MTGDDDGSMLYYGSIAGGRKVSWLFVICTSIIFISERGEAKGGGVLLLAGSQFRLSVDEFASELTNFVCPSTNSPVS